MEPINEGKLVRTTIHYESRDRILYFTRLVTAIL